MTAPVQSPTAPAPADRAVWAPGRRVLTAGLVLAVTLVAFESLAVTTILPKVTADLGDLFLYGWTISAFMLASLIGIVVSGALVDRIGMVAPMAAGIVLFAVGLLIGGLAPTMWILVGGRVLQGIGAGVVPAVSWAAVARAYPPGARPRMVAVISTAWVVPALVGPAVASIIATTIGWRWVFLLLLLPVLAAGAVAVRALGVVRRPEHPQPADLRILPVLGVVLGSAVALAGLELQNPFLLAGAVVVGAAVMIPSLRRLTPAGTLRARAGVPATILTRGLATAAYYAVHAFVPYALVTVRDASTFVGAAAISASTIAWTAAAWMQERLIQRFGPRRLVRVGEALLALGIAGMLVTLASAVPVWVGIVAWTVGGVGMGLAYSPLSVTTMNAAHDGGEGRAMASLQLLDLLGQAIGIGVAGAAIAAFPTVHGTTPATGTAIAFGVGLVVAFVALLVVRRLPRGLHVDATGPTPTSAPTSSAAATSAPATSSIPAPAAP